MKTYIFPIELEQADGAWHVYVPGLVAKGAATWGTSREEALKNIQEVMQMVVEDLLEDGEELPANIQVSETAAGAICV